MTEAWVFMVAYAAGMVLAAAEWFDYRNERRRK